MRLLIVSGAECTDLLGTYLHFSFSFAKQVNLSPVFFAFSLNPIRLGWRDAGLAGLCAGVLSGSPVVGGLHLLTIFGGRQFPAPINGVWGSG